MFIWCTTFILFVNALTIFLLSSCDIHIKCVIYNQYYDCILLIKIIFQTNFVSINIFFSSLIDWKTNVA